MYTRMMSDWDLWTSVNRSLLETLTFKLLNELLILTFYNFDLKINIGLSDGHDEMYYYTVKTQRRLINDIHSLRTKVLWTLNDWLLEIRQTRIILVFLPWRDFKSIASQVKRCRISCYHSILYRSIVTKGSNGVLWDRILCKSIVLINVYIVGNFWKTYNSRKYIKVVSVIKTT